jgi:hypothetical protein
MSPESARAANGGGSRFDRLPTPLAAPRNAKRIKGLAERAHPRLRVVDDKSAYFRLTAKETAPVMLYETVRKLLRGS